MILHKCVFSLYLFGGGGAAYDSKTWYNLAVFTPKKIRKVCTETPDTCMTKSPLYVPKLQEVWKIINTEVNVTFLWPTPSMH